MLFCQSAHQPTSKQPDRCFTDHLRDSLASLGRNENAFGKNFRLSANPTHTVRSRPRIGLVSGEKRCGIRLSRNPIVAQSAEYPAGGEAHRPLPFCHTVIFSSYHHAHNQCNARTHHTPHGRRTYERNHVCISRHYRQYRRSRCDGMISYATSCSVCNAHDRILTTNAW